MAQPTSKITTDSLFVKPGKVTLSGTDSTYVHGTDVVKYSCTKNPTGSTPLTFSPDDASIITQVTFVEPGEYNIALNLKDTSGTPLEDTDNITVTVLPKPVANFTFTSEGANVTEIAQGKSLKLTAVDVDHVDSYMFSCGTNSYSGKDWTIPNVNLSPGSYPFKLVVTDKAGQTAEVTKTITVVHKNWDCPIDTCPTSNPPSSGNCHNCGAPRYQPAQPQVLPASPAVNPAVPQSTGWICQCGVSNAGTQNTCTSCGTAKPGPTPAQQSTPQPQGRNVSQPENTPYMTREETLEAIQAAQSNQETQLSQSQRDGVPKSKLNPWLVGFGLIVLVALASGITYYVGKSPESVANTIKGSNIENHKGKTKVPEFKTPFQYCVEMVKGEGKTDSQAKTTCEGLSL
ncbi:MAG: hypothetical protein CL685_01960 [Candidatus Magasanikbacteria bacterium]|nr:hypothetical protein [Candidatus Magasanikbacteria bacterium]